MANPGEVEVEVAVDAHALLGEGPVWDGQARLLIWVDILEGLVHRHDPVAESDEVFDAGQPVGAVAVRSMGGLVLALRDGFAVLDDWGDRLRMVAGTEAGATGNRMNDGKCDLAGRFFGGTMAFESTPGAGTLYRLDTDYSVTPMLEGITISNGPAWSSDNRTMYFTDTAEKTIYSFDYDSASGEMANRRRFIQIEDGAGAPDGMTVDADDFLWVAVYGGGAVRRYSPDGVLDRTIELPATQITSCTFAGDDLAELYITSASQNLIQAELREQPHAGALFVCAPGPEGLPPNDFKG